jgi:hypothetical protein
MVECSAIPFKKKWIHIIQQNDNYLRAINNKQQLTKRTAIHRIPRTCGKVYISLTGHHTSTTLPEHIRGNGLEHQGLAAAEHHTKIEPQQTSIPKLALPLLTIPV